MLCVLHILCVDSAYSTTIMATTVCTFLSCLCKWLFAVFFIFYGTVKRGLEIAAWLEWKVNWAMKFCLGENDEVENRR